MGMLRNLRRGATLVGLGVAGGAAIITVRHLLDTPQPLNSGLPGEGRIDRRHGGDIYYNVAGPAKAKPIVLLHDFYPGASNFEYRAVFSALADRYRVYAPDWLGFGMSEHPNIAYTGEFYAHLLTGFVRDVVAQPAIIVAHGLAANIAVRAASDTPALFERLILISPEDRVGLRQQATLGQTLARVTQRTMTGIVPYALLSTKPALRLFSKGTARLSLETEREELHHRYMSAHQFGGHYALMALLTGELDLPMRHVFQLLEQPSLIVSGELDPRHPAEALEELAILNSRADLDILTGIGAAILEEEPNEFLHFVDRWLTAPALSRSTSDAEALVGAALAASAAESTDAAVATDVTDEAAAWLPEDEPPAPDLSGQGKEAIQEGTPEAIITTEQVVTPDDLVTTPEQVVDVTKNVATPADEVEGEDTDTEAEGARNKGADPDQDEKPFISRPVRRTDESTASTQMPLPADTAIRPRNPTTPRRKSGGTTRKSSSRSNSKNEGK